MPDGGYKFDQSLFVRSPETISESLEKRSIRYDDDQVRGEVRRRIGGALKHEPRTPAHVIHERDKVTQKLFIDHHEKMVKTKQAELDHLRATVGHPEELRALREEEEQLEAQVVVLNHRLEDLLGKRKLWHRFFVDESETLKQVRTELREAVDALKKVNERVDSLSGVTPEEREQLWNRATDELFFAQQELVYAREKLAKIEKAYQTEQAPPDDVRAA